MRYHEGDIARIEVPPADIARLSIEPIRSELSRTFREIGFQFVTIDLEGFRSGSLNDLISLDVKVRYGASRS